MAILDLIPGVAQIKAAAETIKLVLVAIAGGAVAIIITAGVYEFPRIGIVARSVRAATAQLVTQAELDSARATAEAERMLRMAAQKRADGLDAANRTFAERLAAAEIENGNLDDQIAELLARPVAGDCTVDADLLQRLRNR